MERNYKFQDELYRLLRDGNWPLVSLPVGSANYYYVIPADSSSISNGAIDPSSVLVKQIEDLLSRIAWEIKENNKYTMHNLVDELRPLLDKGNIISDEQAKVMDDNDCKASLRMAQDYSEERMEIPNLDFANESLSQNGQDAIESSHMDLPPSLEDGNISEQHFETGEVPTHVTSGITQDKIEEYEEQINSLFSKLDVKEDSLRFIGDSLMDLYLNLYHYISQPDDDTGSIPPYVYHIKSVLAGLLDKMGVYILEVVDNAKFDAQYMSVYSELGTTDPYMDGRVKLQEPGFYRSDEDVCFNPDDMQQLEILRQPQVVLYKYQAN